MRLILQRSGTENAGVFGEIALWQGSHDATATRARNAQTHSVSNGKRAAYPLILHKALRSGVHLEHDIRAEPPNLEAPLWIQFSELLDGGSRQHMHDRTIW